MLGGFSVSLGASRNEETRCGKPLLQFPLLATSTATRHNEVAFQLNWPLFTRYFHGSYVFHYANGNGLFFVSLSLFLFFSFSLTISIFFSLLLSYSLLPLILAISFHTIHKHTLILSISLSPFLFLFLSSRFTLIALQVFMKVD